MKPLRSLMPGLAALGPLMASGRLAVLLLTGLVAVIALTAVFGADKYAQRALIVLKLIRREK